jgi:hypothetical protein
MATSDTAAGTAGTVQRPALNMIQLVDQLFDAFTELTFDYHKAASARPDAVKIERPVHVKAGDPRYGGYGGAAYSGRLALREWSLVVRGQPERIDGVLITSDQLIPYNANPNNFARFFAIELKSTGDWMIGRKPFTADQLPALAQQLHSALVRAAKRGRATASFRFSTGKTTTMDAVSLPSDAQGGVAHSNMLPQRPRSYYEDSDPLFAALNPTAPPPEPMPSAQPLQQFAQTSTSDAFGERSTFSQTLSVSEALRAAYDGLTAELAAIQQAVTQAIEFGDNAGAEELVKRSARVKVIQERAQALCQEWRQIKPGG